jgi:hypothetical protein
VRKYLKISVSFISCHFTGLLFPSAFHLCVSIPRSKAANDVISSVWNLYSLVTSFLFYILSLGLKLCIVDVPSGFCLFAIHVSCHSLMDVYHPSLISSRADTELWLGVGDTLLQTAGFYILLLPPCPNMCLANTCFSNWTCEDKALQTYRQQWFPGITML